MINYSACSTKGKSRKINQDRVMVNNQCIDEGSFEGKSSNELIAIVCDGVGSTKGSENAAEFVSNSFKDFNVSMLSPVTLVHHLRGVNKTIIDKQKGHTDFADMATTIAGIAFYKNRYLIFNMGDTQVYQYNNGVLSLISKRNICVSNGKEVVTSYMGGKDCNIYMRKGKAIDESYFIICSDGVYKNISNDAIKHALEMKSTLTEKKDAILQLALQNGSTDDSSLIVLQYNTNQYLDNSSLNEK